MVVVLGVHRANHGDVVGTPCREREELRVCTPQSPAGRNLNGEPSKLPWALSLTRSVNDAGIGWPSRRFSSGLGSSRSMWLGPPCWKSWITARARGRIGGDNGRAVVLARGTAPVLAQHGPSARPANPVAVRLNQCLPAQLPDQGLRPDRIREDPLRVSPAAMADGAPSIARKGIRCCSAGRAPSGPRRPVPPGHAGRLCGPLRPVSRDRSGRPGTRGSAQTSRGGRLAGKEEPIGIGDTSLGLLRQDRG